MRAEANRRDRMTPHERRIAMERGEETDRIPVIPFIGEISGRLVGISSREYWHDAAKMVEAELAAFTRLGHDELSLGPNTCGILESLGGTVVYPEEGMPYFDGAYLKDYRMLDEMEPASAANAERLLFFREAMERMKEAADGIVDVAPSIGGPFTIAANLRGVEQFLRDLRKEPEQVQRLLRLVTDTMKNCVDMVAPFADGIRLADPVASPALISPRYFQELVYPYLVEIMEYAEEKTGKRPSLHICGNTKKVWEYFREMPIRAISLDNIMDLGEAKEALGDRMTIVGNLPPVECLLEGSEETLREEIRRETDLAKGSPKGYISASGCDVPYNTDLKKLDIWMDEVRTMAGL